MQKTSPLFLFATLILFQFVTTFFSSCSNSIELKPNGTYIRTSDNELRILTDTIKIAPANSYNDNLYHITQSSATYFKNPKDSQFNKRNKPNTITGTLNKTKAQIETEDPGIVYTITNDGQSISINGITYNKIH